MKRLIAGIAGLLLGASALAADNVVQFNVSVKRDGEVVASPSFLATVGHPATLRFGEGRGLINIEAWPKPVEPDGRSWTQVRITYLETEDSRFVQEMHMRHEAGDRNGSFEFTDPSKRKFNVEVRQ